mgnify:CR=1 FL=1
MRPSGGRLAPTQIGRVFAPDYGIVSDAHAGLKAATHQVTSDGQTALLGGDSITALDTSVLQDVGKLANLRVQLLIG